MSGEKSTQSGPLSGAASNGVGGRPVVVGAGGRRPDIWTRLFGWYWRRQARLTNNPRALLRVLEERRAVIETLATRMEAKISDREAPVIPVAGREWNIRPEYLIHAREGGSIASPQSGLYLDPLLSVHHDDTAGSFLISQRPTRTRDGATGFEIYFESYEFSGGYFSFSLDAPDDAARPSSSERLVFTIDLRARWPMRGYVRLNLQSVHGRETLYADAMLGEGEARFAFDLAFAPFELTQSDTIWVDLILDRPRMTEFTVADMTLSLETP